MNDMTFQGSGKITYVPVVVDAKQKPITNADAVRAMTDEELAELIAYGCCRNIDCPDEFYMEDGLNCYGCWLDWLRQEAQE